jgi:hypothetical protein
MHSAPARRPPELAQPDLVPVPVATQSAQHPRPPELGVGVAALLHLVRKGVLGSRQRDCKEARQGGRG